MQKRNTHFDALKGSLIILVMIGHILPGELDENVIRGAIYFFHMPLFLAITGYFSYKTYNSSLLAVYKKQWHRMILPFVVAFTFYTFINLYAHSFDIHHTITRLLYPYYHLWYIPAIVIFTAYTHLLRRLRSTIALPAGMAISAVALFYFKFNGNDDSDLLYFMGDKRYYYYYIFYVFGYTLSASRPAGTAGFPVVSIAMAILACVLYYVVGDNAIKGAAYIAANLSIIHVCIAVISRNTSDKRTTLSKIGEISLPLYLWHAFPLLIFQKLFADRIAIYYLSSIFACSAVLMIFLSLDRDHPFYSKYFFGKDSPEVKARPEDATESVSPTR